MGEEKPHMATEQQINANRENAKLSSGPTSPEGIARSSQNALKHGLLGRTVHLTPEEEEPYRLFHESLFHTLKPRGANEEYLVESLIDSRWRIAQISQIEAGLYALGLIENKSELANHPVAQASQIARALTFKQNQKEFEKLNRYQGRLQRQATADFKKLEEITTRLTVAGGYRNSIVHGQWGLTSNRDQILVNGVTHEYMWIRIYVFADKQKEFARLLALLDSDEFEVREMASAELKTADSMPRELVSKALEKNPSEEVRTRLEAAAKLIADRLRTMTDSTGVSISLTRDGYLNRIAESGASAKVPGSSHRRDADVHAQWGRQHLAAEAAAPASWIGPEDSGLLSTPTAPGD